MRAAPHPPPAAAPDLKDVSAEVLAAAFDRYNAFVRSVVPADRLLELDYFDPFPAPPTPTTSACADAAAACVSGVTLRARWSARLEARIGRFVRGTAPPCDARGCVEAEPALVRCNQTCYRPNGLARNKR